MLRSIPALIALAMLPLSVAADDFKLTQRKRVVSPKDKTQYDVVLKETTWNPKQTAVIVCDMWDSHHSLNAVKRVVEIAPRMNEVLVKARAQGALVIHAPSSCMEPYKNHPGRKLAMAAPKAANLPKEIGKWCFWIPSEEKDKYPIDQVDGGCDTPDGPQKEWQAKLKSDGRNPGSPWKAQIDLIKIHDNDAVSDSGVEIWNLLEQRGINNVILVGVHTNMCVLGRPFGLRQMAQNGKNVVLMRDMTDTMYNPKSWPFVNHFQGTDLIVAHIEKYVCPTITSDQILGGKAFKFKDDVRKQAVVIVSEAEYDTDKTLPPLAKQVLSEQLGLETRMLVEKVASKPIPGFADAVSKADLIILSARRRALPPEDMKAFQTHLDNGKPLLAIRTSSHAWDTKGKAPKGWVEWLDFDAKVIGGNYGNHHKVGPITTVRAAAEGEAHPILTGVKLPFTTVASLYRNTPLKSSARAILTGTIPDQPTEPIAWTNEYKKAKVFYTSLGHKEDFTNPSFQRLFHNASRWLLAMPIAEGPPKKVRGAF